MSGAHTTSNYSRMTVALGWLITAVLTAHMLVTVRMPRVEKTSVLREELRGWHYLAGLILFMLLLARLWRWWQERHAAPAGMTAGGHAWARTLALTSYVVLAIMPVLGICQAWTDGLTVHLGPFVELPALVAETRAGWLFFGYFHSALGFATLLLALAGVFTLAWQWLLRGVGLTRAFPPGFGAQVWLLMAINLYATTTFREPSNPAPVLGVYFATSAGVWALGAWLRRRRRAMPIAVGPSGRGMRFTCALVIAGLIAVAAWSPYAMFRVTPWPVGVAIAAPAGITSHAGPVTRVVIAPETDFERHVKAETYKWCRFCHTVGQNDKHLAGPNLYAVFGQRAATAPNFHYSKAMAEAGRKGLVWDEATLDRYLAGPDEFVPGTSMAISIGPIRDPATRAAVINILKRETMPAP